MGSCAHLAWPSLPAASPASCLHLPPACQLEARGGSQVRHDPPLPSWPPGGIHPCDLLLLMACTEGDDGKVNELLEAGADPNVKVRTPQGAAD